MASPTTVGDLLDYTRLQLNSEKVGGADTYALWKDSELIDYIDQAQQEFSRLTECIPDYSTFSLSVISDTREYNYDSRIINVFGGWLTTLARRVRSKSFDEVEKGHIIQSGNIINHGRWETETGIPKFIIPDMELNKLVLWPKPTSNDTLTLYCFKIADHVSSTSDNLEIDSAYRLGLNYRVMALAYGKHDVVETEDMQRSTLYSQKWQSFWQDAKQTFDKRFNRI